MERWGGKPDAPNLASSWCSRSPIRSRSHPCLRPGCCSPSVMNLEAGGWWGAAALVGRGRLTSLECGESKMAAVTPRGWADNDSIGRSGGRGELFGVSARNRGGLVDGWSAGPTATLLMEMCACPAAGNALWWGMVCLGRCGGGSAGCAQATSAKPDRTVQQRQVVISPWSCAGCDLNTVESVG